MQIEELLRSKLRNGRHLPLLISPGSEKDYLLPAADGEQRPDSPAWAVQRRIHQRMRAEAQGGKQRWLPSRHVSGAAACGVVAGGPRACNRIAAPGPGAGIGSAAAGAILNRKRRLHLEESSLSRPPAAARRCSLHHTGLRPPCFSRVEPTNQWTTFSFMWIHTGPDSTQTRDQDDGSIWVGYGLIHGFAEPVNRAMNTCRMTT